MNRFVENAQRLLEAAESALETGHTPSDTAVVINGEGGIHVVQDASWSLQGLQQHHGARMVYRIRSSDNTVQVEGRAGSRICFFETAKASRIARQILQDRPLYQLVRPQLAAPAA